MTDELQENNACRKEIFCLKENKELCNRTARRKHPPSGRPCRVLLSILDGCFFGEYQSVAQRHFEKEM
jgi:hypothetical protein